jgi:hypothetical protein
MRFGARFGLRGSDFVPILAFPGIGDFRPNYAARLGGHDNLVPALALAVIENDGPVVKFRPRKRV